MFTAKQPAETNFSHRNLSPVTRNDKSHETIIHGDRKRHCTPTTGTLQDSQGDQNKGKSDSPTTNDKDTPGFPNLSVEASCLRTTRGVRPDSQRY